MNCRPVAVVLIAVAARAMSVHAEERNEPPTSAVVTSGAVRITSTLDKSTASVAEPIQLKLTVQAPQGSRIEWPSLDKKLGPLDLTRVARSNDIPSASSPNLREWVLQLTLESIKSGDLEIPSIDIRYAKDATSEFQSIQSSPLKLQILSVLEDRSDPTRFRDIKQTVDIPLPETHSKIWIVWTGAAATAVALLLLAIAVRRRLRGVAPADWALTSIAELERMNSSGADATTRFNDVVEIIREFLELEFGVRSLSQTTNEFLSSTIYEIDLPPQTTERLRWLASVADEIKFARLGIGSQHFEQAVVQAKALVVECDQHRRTTAKGAA